MERLALMKAQQVRATPKGMRGSSLRRRVNFCQRLSSKNPLEKGSAEDTLRTINGPFYVSPSNEEGKGASDILDDECPRSAET